MREDISEYIHGSQNLGSVLLRGEFPLLPIEILHIRYVQHSVERVATTFTPYTHQHSYFEAHVPIDGTQVYRVMDEEITVEANEAIIISPKTLHSIPYTSENLCKFSFGFSLLDAPKDAEFVWAGAALRDCAFLKTQANRWYTDVLRQVLLEGARQKPGFAAIIMELIALLLIQMVREPLPREESGEVRDEQQHKRMESIERFITDNISAMITNQMVSEHMFLSVRQLDRITQAQRGVTLKGLVDLMKMDEAKHLLRETSLDLKDISTALGFSETSSFIRYFRRFENTPPGLYRKMCGLNDAPETNE